MCVACDTASHVPSPHEAVRGLTPVRFAQRHSASRTSPCGIEFGFSRRLDGELVRAE